MRYLCGVCVHDERVSYIENEIRRQSACEACAS
jgi:hypothetical protein